MKALICITMIAILVTCVSPVAMADWTARLRGIPVGVGLKPRLIFDAQGGPMGELRDLQSEFSNVIGEAITIDWEVSSLQLPGDQRWHVVHPDPSDGEDRATAVVAAGAQLLLRVCPVDPVTEQCNPSWLRNALLVEDFSLTLRLAIEIAEEVRPEEWRWDFDYEEDEPLRPKITEYVPILTLALAAAAIVLVLLLAVL